MNHIAWTQWDDLVAPEGVTLLGPASAPLDSDLIETVTFYAPPYMSGLAGLEPSRRMPNLQYLQMPNAGYDETHPFRRENLLICNARGVHDVSTSELALALTLASLRGLDDYVLAQKSGEWLSGTRPSLAYKRVALVGYGSIGKRIALMLSPFDVDLVAFTRTGSEGTTKMSEFDSLLPTFDVVILIIPANADSVGLMNEVRLAKMKDGALLVNVARGVIVDTDALVAELASGRIRAALDVTDPEPLEPNHPLWQQPGLIISPHVGGNSSAFPRGMRNLLQTQFERLSLGEEPINVVLRGI
jgi:phosphoglycerate dehydrogenase-like enzyme